ncbi:MULTISPECIES: methyltransferase domain-containing protein [Pseudonocardia]|uniref:Demethylmenaquinone methyltransferase n=2 Tax=Pseudonocardia TaxID=1847 RepID=A0A1Y2MJ58_PSEAH|nr:MULTISPECIES: methyltransferase domain-containing protein [Pseudonocardia]OSY34488.1 Demethylmenaquinone methyltransferase [Pseudonocardia autotrophica]OZM75485.1 methyltransferase [Pseudonocardia sp. MH-G8]TDN77172.1 methyltransferase family protein [Pseudonocardia autotrophica]BBG01183.1 hypothetical protein Pdca_23920 [Pseudonocardia autotrophica]GEC29665.1 hypothetical protein PSA01_66940 [Pseudonocardia saturnea]
MIARQVLAAMRPAPTPAQLARVLRPRTGERILEIRPGLGHHARHIAGLVGPSGQVHLLDTPEHMLDDARLRTAGLQPRVIARVADARRLPLDDHSMDAAYLVGALSTLPDPGCVLDELHRVLRPGGRLVIAEHYRAHWLTLRDTHALARRHRFRVEHHTGRLRYLTLLRPSTSPTPPDRTGHRLPAVRADT